MYFEFKSKLFYVIWCDVQSKYLISSRLAAIVFALIYRRTSWIMNMSGSDGWPLLLLLRLHKNREWHSNVRARTRLSRRCVKKFIFAFVNCEAKKPTINVSCSSCSSSSAAIPVLIEIDRDFYLWSSITVGRLPCTLLAPTAWFYRCTTIEPSLSHWGVDKHRLIVEQGIQVIIHMVRKCDACRRRRRLSPWIMLCSIKKKNLLHIYLIYYNFFFPFLLLSFSFNFRATKSGILFFIIQPYSACTSAPMCIHNEHQQRAAASSA